MSTCITSKCAHNTKYTFNFTKQLLIWLCITTCNNSAEWRCCQDELVHSLIERQEGSVGKVVMQLLGKAEQPLAEQL